MQDMFSLEGKVAVIVGGGGVLAGEMAHGFADSGASIVVVDVNIDNAEARARAVRETGRTSVAVHADASQREDMERALQTTIDRFGRVDILINAAGINSGTPFFDITDEEWHRILDVDLKSMFLGCQIFGRKMVEAQQGGSIINISSIASDPPLSKVFTYSVAKGGINQLTRFLAREWAPHRIRVNAILPGFVPAEQNRKLLTPERTAQVLGHTPMGRFGEPHELVGAAIFLAAERASSFVTGTLLRVDGGFGAMSI
ncbi:MAG TPA: glucose 1-dehydrogenase [Bryobacteraceae bacterium]|nr:glucose 1-dehydrogenase [Bryobacteraceae bacterium]